MLLKTVLLIMTFIPAKALSGDIFIRIFKQQNQLEIWEKEGDQYQLFETYPICYYSGKLGPKEAQGDRQAPEGIYSMGKSSLNPHSNYHLSFNIGYPNKLDKALGRTGGLIMVHGDCVSIGCFAMTDKLIEKIYGKVEEALKTQKYIPIHIFPFPLTKLRLTFYRWHDYSDFWNELAPIYTYFEENKKLPPVEIKGTKYVLKEDK